MEKIEEMKTSIIIFLIKTVKISNKTLAEIFEKWLFG